MAKYIPKYADKYIPRDTIGASKYGNVKYVAYLVERYARFNMPVDGRQSCRMSIWSPVKQDAEIFAIHPQQFGGIETRVAAQDLR